MFKCEAKSITFASADTSDVHTSNIPMQPMHSKIRTRTWTSQHEGRGRTIGGVFRPEFLFGGFWLARWNRWIQQNRARRPKSVWVHETFRQKEIQKEDHNLLKELQVGDREYYPYLGVQGTSWQFHQFVIWCDRGGHNLGFKFNQGGMEWVFLHFTFPCVCTCVAGSYIWNIHANVY